MGVFTPLNPGVLGVLCKYTAVARGEKACLRVAVATGAVDGASVSFWPSAKDQNRMC